MSRRRWWVCVCGRPLYDHTRVEGKYVCLRYERRRGRVEAVTRPFESETTDVKYDPESGLRCVEGGP